MAIAYSNISVELREILLKDRPDKLYDISPKGTVPVLQFEDRVIDESLDIMLWAAESSDNCSWKSSLDKQLTLIKDNDEGFKLQLDKYKYHDRYPDKSRDYYWLKCTKFLKIYNDLIKEHNGGLFSNEMTLSDIAIFPFVRQCANVDINRISEFSYIKSWLDNMLSSKLFTSVMQKYDVWDIDKKPLIVNFNENR